MQLFGHQFIRLLRTFPIKTVVNNNKVLKKKAEKELRVGIQLLTSEVKSVRERQFDLSNAVVDIENEELFLHHSIIPGTFSTTSFYYI